MLTTDTTPASLAARETRAARARSFTVTSEPGYTYVGPCGAVVLAQFLGTTPEPCDCFRTGVCPTLEGVTP